MSAPLAALARRCVYFFIMLCLARTAPAQRPASVLAPDILPPRLVGYFPQWGLYEQPQFLVRNLATTPAAGMLDQINYAQAFVTGGRCTVADPNADLHVRFTSGQSVDGIADGPKPGLHGSFKQLIKLKRMYPKLKILISLEGRASDFAANAQPATRDAFVASCVSLFLAGHLAPGLEAGPLFDGIDLDWEYPGIEGVDNFVALLREFRKQMEVVRPGALLTIAVGPHPHMAGGDDLAEVAATVDEVGLMTYDMAGPWSKRTGFHAALLPHDASHPQGTGEQAVEAFLAAGVPARKLLLGVPFYGYGWRKVPDENGGLFEEGEGIRGDRPYAELEEKTATSTAYRDPVSQAPWLFDGDEFWTYDDPKSIQFKAEYVKNKHLGGVMAWELGEDSSSSALLQAAYQGLHSERPPRTEAADKDCQQTNTVTH